MISRRPPPLVSACLIVKDEEGNLPGCLRSLRGFADEIIVYDTGSTDATVAICRALGATVIEGHWDDDFARARNEALAHARGEWIISIDADETFVADDVAGLRRLLTQTRSRVVAYALPVHSYYGDGTAAPTATTPTRLFRRQGQEWAGRLHEEVVTRGCSGPVPALVVESARLVHTGYLDRTVRAKRKHERNIRIATAAAASAEGPAKGLAELTLAQTYNEARQFEAAFHWCGQALDHTDDPTCARMALHLGAYLALTLGRADEALAWTATLRERWTHNTLQADMLEARIRLNRGEYSAALECLDRIGDGVNERNPLHGVAGRLGDELVLPDELPLLRSAALAGLQQKACKHAS